MSPVAGRYWYALMVNWSLGQEALVMVSWSFANIVKDGKADGEENVECRIYRSTKEIKLSIAAKKVTYFFNYK